MVLDICAEVCLVSGSAFLWNVVSWGPVYFSCSGESSISWCIYISLRDDSVRVINSCTESDSPLLFTNIPLTSSYCSIDVLHPLCNKVVDELVDDYVDVALGLIMLFLQSFDAAQKI